jgi:hypothetical protein
VHNARPAVRLNLAELFPKLAYSAVRQVEPERLEILFDAHQTELQSARGESESKDFILEHVYQLTPRSIRTPVDFWREVLRLHFANRALAGAVRRACGGILRGRGLFVGHTGCGVAVIQERAAARGAGRLVSLSGKAEAGRQAHVRA